MIIVLLRSHRKCSSSYKHRIPVQDFVQNNTANPRMIVTIAETVDVEEDPLPLEVGARVFLPLSVPPGDGMGSTSVGPEGAAGATVSDVGDDMHSTLQELTLPAHFTTDIPRS